MPAADSSGDPPVKLAGKAAIVTGGGRGIGRAIALGYARAGCDVCVLARTAPQIEAVADEIRRLGRTAVPVACDVSDADAVPAAIEQAVQRLGRLDVLVNNAGAGQLRAPVGQDDPRQWMRVVEINLFGTYLVSRAALPHLKQSRGGTIINVGSGMGHQPRTGNSSYHCAKSAVWMLTRCLALECWSEGVTVNELIPGPVATELTANVFVAGQPHPHIESEWVKHPGDVVPLALFLAAQSATGPTGQSFSLARRPL